MKFPMIRKGVYFLIAALLATPAVFAAARCDSENAKTSSYKAEGPEEASGLIRNIQDKARDIRDETAVLQTFTREPETVDWRTHADRLEQIRDEVNVMGVDLCRLQEIRSEALPWQKRVIRSIQPSVVELAAYTERAIDFVHQEDLGNYASPDYTVDINGMFEKADRIETTTNDFIEYAKARQEMRGLQHDIRSSAG